MLLTTKLIAPQPHARAVRRDRLLDRLDEAVERPLTLISAPAGFGKTSMLSTWAHERRPATAWYSIDAEDDEPARFWSYLIEALRAVVPTIGQAALQILKAPGPTAGTSLATIVANDVADATESLVCVLDDLHVIDDTAIHAGVEYLVNRAPPNLRFIVATRSDPPWELARYRAQGRMSEVRAAELRFSETEAQGLMSGAGLELSDRAVRSIEARTEGWAAGLQMAALLMHGRKDPDAFIDDFAGSHRFVIDFLTQEVLSQQAEDVRRFLLRTSILDRLEGSLCDTVTEGTGGAEMLMVLEKANVFTDALDDRRTWYRYHQLFSDVLRARLAAEDAETVARLHSLASDWYEAHDLVDEAVHHALEAGDIDRAVTLIGAATSASFVVGDQNRLTGWLERLPETSIARSPVLALMRTWARFVLGDMEGIDASIVTARAAVAAVDDDHESARLQADLDGVLAWVAYQSGDLPACIDLARAARERGPSDGLVPARMVTFALGAALLLSGDLESAASELELMRVQCRRDADRVTEAIALALIGRVELMKGHLGQARTSFQHSIEAGTIAGEMLAPVGIAQVQLGEVLRERNELRDAETALRTGIAICERSLGLPEWVFEGRVTLARVLKARGRDRAATDAAAAAEDFLRNEIIPGGMLPLVARALEYRVRYGVESGDPEAAAGWLQEMRSFFSGSDEAALAGWGSLSARLLLVQERPDEALAAANTFEAGEDSKDVAAVVESRLVVAGALAGLARLEEAAEHLDRALVAGEPEGYVRLYLGFGESVADLLVDAAGSSRATSNLAEFIVKQPSNLAGAGSDHPEHPGVDMIEPLNARETELLQYLAARRSNQEIADEMYISVNTVKWHARNLYGKLGVERRAQAVARAQELGLL